MGPVRDGRGLTVLAPEARADATANAPTHVRDFDDRDLEQVVRLWEDAERDGDGSVFALGEVLEAVRAGEPALVAADEEGLVVGAAAARVEGQRAWVLRWVVAPPVRGRGVGRALLRALERRVLASGAREVAMLVSSRPDGVDAATAAGYAERSGMIYLEKRALARSATENHVADLGGEWPAHDLWTSIGGMEREKDLIERRVVLPLGEPDRAARHGVVPAAAIILFGPPGTGKTTFAKAIAGRLGWPFVEISPSGLGGHDAQSRARALGETFAKLDYFEHVVAFIDEVEEIASHRGARPDTHALVNELLKAIPRFREAGGRLLVCATNSIRDLDHAFTRPGRFDYVLPIGAPDRATRVGIWARYTHQAGDVDVEALAERSRHFSPADIEFAARKAAQVAFERSILGPDDAPATTADYLDAVAEVRPSITAAMTRELEEDVERFARW